MSQPTANWDIFDRCQISAECRRWMNHKKEIVSASNITHDKYNWNKTRITRSYFDGTMEYCVRPGCNWELFHPRTCDLAKCERRNRQCMAGPGKPWKVITVDVKSGEEINDVA